MSNRIPQDGMKVNHGLMEYRAGNIEETKRTRTDDPEILLSSFTFSEAIAVRWALFFAFMIKGIAEERGIPGIFDNLIDELRKMGIVSSCRLFTI